MESYQKKATEIITESIKSAIFIDEKALEFFGEKSDNEVLEEKLSIDLFNNFKEHGVSLAIHKFKSENIDDLNLKNYLFQNRDLVLLDWKLDGDTGEDKSLKLLEDVINSSHIHFCAIYTSFDDLDNVLDNIMGYFSGKTEQYFNEVKENITAYEDQVKEILPRLNIYNSEVIGKVCGELARNEKEFLNAIKDATKSSNYKEALCLLKLAFNSTQKAQIENPIPEIISNENRTVVINNTIITILNKDKDSDPKELINKLSKQVANSKNSFTQLLGLEMQNIFSRKGAFVDANLFKVSKETLVHHRQKMMEDGSTDLPFTQMMKGVLLEHASLNLSNSRLSILEADVMDAITVNGVPPDDELAHMNVFYNALTLKSNKKLNFGDVFADEKGEYYMCVTALCDCFRPSKIKNVYYFVKGTTMNRELALKLGDSGFINFIEFDKAVVWSNIDQEGDDPNIARYQPVYIKPISYQVKDYQFTDNKIEIRRIFHNDAEDAAAKIIGEDIEFTVIKYLTTIKPTYAQRIANHAFAHPIRVGVDFVKKTAVLKAELQEPKATSIEAKSKVQKAEISKEGTAFSAGTA